MADIQKYFTRFGPIEDVYIVNKRSNNVLLIYRDGESASDALQCNNHQISGSPITVTVAKQQPHIPRHHLLLFNNKRNQLWEYKRLPNSTSNITKLININDDCLFHLFKYLSPDHLYTLGCTCDRLQAAIYDFYRSQLIDFNELTIARWLMENRSVLMLFGAHFTELKIKSCWLTNHETRNVFNLIGKYCKNVRALQMHDFKFHCDEMVRSKFTSILHNLTRLTIEYGEIVGSDGLQLNCPLLEELNLAFNAINIDILLNRFPNLKSFSLFTNEFPVKCGKKRFMQRLREFLWHHKQLKSLQLFGTNWDRMFPIIGSRLTHLKEIFFCSNLKPLDVIVPRLCLELEHSFQQLTELSNLKSCRLDFNGKSVQTFLANLKSSNTLECLGICFGIVDTEFFRTLLRYTNLHTLRLCNVIEMPSVHGLRMLNQLTELQIRECCTITKDDVRYFVAHFTHLSLLILISTNFIMGEDCCREIGALCRNVADRSKLCIENYQHGQPNIFYEDDNDDIIEIFGTDDVKYHDTHDSGLLNTFQFR